jgi:hypothetical protein
LLKNGDFYFSPPVSGPLLMTLRKSCLIDAVLLLGLLLDPEDGSDMFPRNVGRLLPDCTADTTLFSPMREPEIQNRCKVVYVLLPLRKDVLFVKGKIVPVLN